MGTEVDLAEAEKFFLLSADQDYAPARENYEVLNKEKNGNQKSMVLVDNDRLFVRVSETVFEARINNLDLKDSYTVIKKGTTESFGFAYVWEIDFSDGTYSYWFGTQIPDYEEKTVSPDDFPATLFRSDLEGKRFTSLSSEIVRVRRNGDSLTWTLPLSEVEPIDFGNINEFTVRVYGQGIQSVSEVYPIE